jgi:hypothetical protein
MGGLVRQGTINIVSQVTVDEGTLQRIAELLGIQGQVISGTIYISTPTSAPSAGPSTRPPSGAAAPAATRRRRRQRE